MVEDFPAATYVVVVKRQSNKPQMRREVKDADWT